MPANARTPRPQIPKQRNRQDRLDQLYLLIMSSVCRTRTMPPVERLAESLGVSVGTIRGDIYALEARKLIRVEGGTNSHRVVTIVETGDSTEDAFEAEGFPSYAVIAKRAIEALYEQRCSGGSGLARADIKRRRILKLPARLSDHLVDQLISDQLVERNDKDRRAVLFTPSAKGLAFAGIDKRNDHPEQKRPAPKLKRPERSAANPIMNSLPRFADKPMRANGCRWMDAHPGDLALEDIPNAFCNAPVKPGSSYCPDHHKLCYDRKLGPVVGTIPLRGARRRGSRAVFGHRSVSA